MDAVQISDICVKLKQQGMPEHLALIHAITYGLTLEQTDYDKKYVLAANLPALIEKELHIILKQWMKRVFTPMAAVGVALWAIISNWDNVTKFLKALIQK